jgi:hypothetical protein
VEEYSEGSQGPTWTVVLLLLMMIVSLKYTDVSEVRTASIIIILNRRSTSSRLYGTKSQKDVIFTLDTVRT